MAIQNCDEFIIVDVTQAFSKVAFAEKSKVREQLPKSHIRG